MCQENKITILYHCVITVVTVLLLNLWCDSIWFRKTNRKKENKELNPEQYDSMASDEDRLSIMDDLTHKISGNHMDASNLTLERMGSSGNWQ